jgi:phage terminase Nu1 subunit (DNA packaging protein)
MGARKAPTIADGRRRLVHAQARRAELRLAREEGELVPAEAVERWLSAEIIEARTVLLGIPSQMKLRCPHLSRQDVLVIDQLIRDALSALAAGRKSEEENCHE